jgi:hypothetical protein
MAVTKEVLEIQERVHLGGFVPDFCRCTHCELHSLAEQVKHFGECMWFHSENLLCLNLRPGCPYSQRDIVEPMEIQDDFINWYEELEALVEQYKTLVGMIGFPWE